MGDLDILKTLQVLETTHGNSREVIYSVHISGDNIYLVSDIGHAGSNNNPPKHEWRISKTDPNIEKKLNDAIQFILNEAEVV